LHLRGVANNGRAGAQPVCVDVFFVGLDCFGGFFNNGLDFGLFKGFGNIVKGAAFNGFDCGVHRSVCRYHNNRNFRMCLSQGFQQFHSPQFGHDQVRDDDVDFGFLDEGQGFFAMGGEAHLIALFAQDGGQDFAKVGFVVNNEDVEHGCWKTYPRG